MTTRRNALYETLRNPLLVWLLVDLVIACSGVWAHLSSLTEVPRGLYIDESSNGYNAHLLATTGHDEYGVSWPLFFRSFGDYKNPLYVYLVVAIYRVFGFSIWATRFTSAVCWMAGTYCLYALGRRMWKDPLMRASLLLALCFTPWIFCLSRISFELIALYPVLSLFLLATYRGFEEGSLGWSLVSGLTLGLSTYGYMSFRLLAPCHCAVLAVCYFRREYARRLAICALGAAVVVLPFLFYLLQHHDALTSRFHQVGFAGGSLPLSSQLAMFAERYFGYFSPSFLVASGDPNPRHHSGFGGELLLVSGLGLALACLAFVSDAGFRASRFHRLLFGCLLVSPLAAALTWDVHHALRTFSMALYAIVLSIAGIQYVSKAYPRAVVRLLCVGLALNACLFVRDYFGNYVMETARVFGSSGLEQAMRTVWTARGRVIVNTGGYPLEAMNVTFMRAVVGSDSPGKAPEFIHGTKSDLRPGDALLQLEYSNHARGAYPANSWFIARDYPNVNPLRVQAKLP